MNSAVRDKPILPNRPPNKYIRPAPTQGKAKAMTIAAGLVCSDGVVLGADTEIALSQTGRTYERKIFCIQPELGCHLTYSGNVYLVRELVEDIRNTTRNEDGTYRAHVTSENCLELIQQKYREAMKSELEKEPTQQIWTELLLTIRKDKRHLYRAGKEFETCLYHLSGDSTLRVDRYVASGVGHELAHSVFEPRYRPHVSSFEGTLAIIGGIRVVKKFVQGCGGSTNVIIVRNDDSFPSEEGFGKEEIQQIERDYEFVENAINRLLVDVPSSISADGFDYNLEVLHRQLTQWRAERKVNPISSTSPSEP